jgi:hypothetical protein
MDRRRCAGALDESATDQVRKSLCPIDPRRHSRTQRISQGAAQSCTRERTNLPRAVALAPVGLKGAICRCSRYSPDQPSLSRYFAMQVVTLMDTAKAKDT